MKQVTSAGAALVELSELLLDLHYLARGSAHFEDAALDAVRRRLPFESALWRWPAGEHNRGLGGHCYRAPAKMLQDLQRLGEHDALAARAGKRPGITLSASVSDSRQTWSSPFAAFARAWSIERVLTTACRDPVLDVHTTIMLCRGAESRPFTERERRFKQCLMPHLVAAWTLNTLARAENGATGPRAARERALIDRNGLIHHADPGFARLLQTEFPGWRGPRLPAALSRRLTDPAGESWRGRAIVASRARVVGELQCLVNLRLLGGTDRLSARELAVAREFAAGRTHREIAAGFGISPATVRNQIQSVYAKLDVDSKVELARQLEMS